MIKDIDLKITVPTGFISPYEEERWLKMNSINLTDWIKRKGLSLRLQILEYSTCFGSSVIYCENYIVPVVKNGKTYRRVNLVGEFLPTLDTIKLLLSSSFKYTRLKLEYHSIPFYILVTKLNNNDIVIEAEVYYGYSIEPADTYTFFSYDGSDFNNDCTGLLYWIDYFCSKIN